MVTKSNLLRAAAGAPGVDAQPRAAAGARSLRDAIAGVDAAEVLPRALEPRRYIHVLSTYAGKKRALTKNFWKCQARKARSF